VCGQAQQLLKRVWTLLTPTPVRSGDMEKQMSGQSWPLTPTAVQPQGVG